MRRATLLPLQCRADRQRASGSRVSGNVRFVESNRRTGLENSYVDSIFDMNSGGDQKLDWEYIYIEAPEK